MLEAVRQRLDTMLQRPRWADVAVAEDVDELTRVAGQVADCSAVVMPWRERTSHRIDLTGGFRQRVETEFAVGMVVRDYSGSMGAQRAIRFDTLKSDIEGVLAGWLPDGFLSPCELIGGESSPITTGVSIYVQTWATARFLTGVNQ